jgi:hypothetical protein
MKDLILIPYPTMQFTIIYSPKRPTRSKMRRCVYLFINYLGKNENFKLLRDHKKNDEEIPQGYEYSKILNTLHKFFYFVTFGKNKRLIISRNVRRGYIAFLNRFGTKLGQNCSECSFFKKMRVFYFL